MKFLVVKKNRLNEDNTDDYLDFYLELSHNNKNDFDAYVNQNTEPTDDVLAWWRNRGKGFPKLQPMARDVLAIQASSVASKGIFSAARFQIGEHMHSLAVDSLEISVLFRDWINAERRNLGREPLPTRFQSDVDEIIQDYNNSEIEHIKQDAVSELDSSVPFREKDLIVGPDAGFNGIRSESIKCIGVYNSLVIMPTHQSVSYSKSREQLSEEFNIISTFQLERKLRQGTEQHAGYTLKLIVSTVERLVPALTPEAPAFFNPFFLIIKLAPMNKLEDKARTNPLILSDDMPLYTSFQLCVSIPSTNHKKNPKP
uniref:HAT C-terminal dimerisation domain-containing protein n=1 Tax=Solanum lycopersicum TaxID=4081 RepID=A0A3Q7IF39_SOLLC